ncbi:polysaccharide pyruvyl transferase family protein [Lunatibacter salilacus]|uniref:polysaccharide pyruvyl transferase family protein n=1 Tax=Lunatibacter salilacus TaxID=2483804 RepID=UPI00131B61D6|nr:polysaccharide pyruvyl transferase family protein [Lunatibacter salilacus]
MKIAIITTYPESGSMNIGDRLITEATIDLIKYSLGDHNVEFKIIWRRAEFNSVENDLKKCDLIVFACLSIRKNMVEDIYPFLPNILELNKKIFVIAAGTQLNHFHHNKDWLIDISDNSRIALLELDKKSSFFSTRGLLTQKFCNFNGLINAKFGGDIAFFDKRFLNRKFKSINSVKRIAISDPHYSSLFLESLQYLVTSLNNLFRSAEIEILLHGKNQIVEEFSFKNGIKCRKIYLEQDGLDAYDDFDIHVGYRIHGCVSMLKRKKISYLLEQDGRGIDYGITFPIKISVPNTIEYRPGQVFKNFIKIISGRDDIGQRKVDLKPVDLLLAIIENDLKTNFSRFKQLDIFIDTINFTYIEAFGSLN